MSSNNEPADDLPEATDLERVRRIYQAGMQNGPAGSHHVSDALWEKLACGELSAEERTRVADHITRCRTCFDMYRATRELREGARAFDSNVPHDAPPAVVKSQSASLRPWWPYAAAAAIVLAAVLVPLMRSSAPEPEVTRTLSPAPTVVLTAPLGTVALGSALFEWQAVPGAQAYRVRLFSEQGVPLWTSADVAGTSVARPDSVPLPAGRYFWRVTARADGEILAESALTPFVISP